MSGRALITSLGYLERSVSQKQKSGGCSGKLFSLFLGKNKRRYKEPSEKKLSNWNMGIEYIMRTLLKAAKTFNPMCHKK